jgi:hypothetical protein
MADLVTLLITDGTTVIPLLGDGSTFKLQSWTPNIPDYKGGGTFRNSPLVDGRQLVNKKWDALIDTFVFTGLGSSPDSLITLLADLRRVFEKASEYWTTKWQNTPVWIEAKALGETNARYALIVKGRIPTDAAPYQDPFVSVQSADSIAESLSLVLEHSFWAATPPGVVTALPISAVEAFNGTNFGNVNSAGARVTKTTDEVFIANKRTIANLTHIFTATSGGVFSANLLNAALPYNLFSSNIANSAVYFGISTGVAGFGPFNSIVLDIGTASNFINTVWEYWNGAAWVALTVADSTALSAALPSLGSRSGVGSIHWAQPTNWSTTAVNGVTAWWVRNRVVTGTGATSPTQQNRNPYSIVWPYVEIASADIGGDIPSLVEAIIRNRSNPAFDATLTSGADRIIVGTRTRTRGLNFTSFINFAGGQNDSFVTVTLGVHTGSSNSPYTATGSFLKWTATTIFETIVTVSIPAPQSADFIGRFRAFVRMGQESVGAPSTPSVQLTVQAGASGVIVANSPVIGLGGITQVYDAVDLGIIEIPADLIGSDSLGTLSFILQGILDQSSVIVDLYDLILIPADEWSGEFDNGNVGSLSTIAAFGNNGIDNVYLDIDSIRLPKRMIRSLSFQQNANMSGYYEPRSAGPALLQANSAQRVYMLMIRDRTATTAGWYNSLPSMASSIQLKKQQRYISARGNR